MIIFFYLKNDWLTMITTLGYAYIEAINAKTIKQ